MSMPHVDRTPTTQSTPARPVSDEVPSSGDPSSDRLEASLRELAEARRYRKKHVTKRVKALEACACGDDVHPPERDSLSDG